MTKRIYKLRAEIPKDVDALIKRLRLPPSAYVRTGTTLFDGFELEFSSSLTVDELLSEIETIEDGHVMAETLEPVELYTGEREYGREAPRPTLFERLAEGVEL